MLEAGVTDDTHENKLDVKKCTIIYNFNTFSELASFVAQIWPPLIISGFGFAFTGILLNHFQGLEVFKQLPQLFILVPPLLDIKGDLEMTLNSRLSTEANKGTLHAYSKYKPLLVANLALTQIQAIVVSFFAATYALILGETSGVTATIGQSLLLILISLTTATLAAGILSATMCGVIVFSSQRGFNPDNFANSITASLGDILTLSILIVCSGGFLIMEEQAPIVLVVLVVGQFMMIPTWIRLSRLHQSVHQVLRSGWIPILTAMVISGIAGLMLEKEILIYPKIGLLVPIVNGIGGNIGAILASRSATSFHMRGKPDSLGPSFVLLLLSFPTHLLLLVGLDLIIPGVNILEDTSFIGYFLCATMVQVGAIIFLVNIISRKVWSAGLDPDNWVIPYVTAVADFFGTALLAYSFIYAEKMQSDDPQLVPV